MNRRELRARRRALKAQLKELKARAEARIAQNPLVQQARRRRRIRRTVLSAAALLLLLFVRCDCGEGPPEPQPAAAADAGLEKPPPKTRDAGHPRPKPLTGKIDPRDRSGMPPNAGTSQPWIEQFRIQVAARSPRLAQCFMGSDRPGALRWSASVNPLAGTVSDHELEPVGVSGDLDKEQHDCVIGVLSKPPYQLDAADAGGLPDRVSLVIEF